MRYNSSDKSLRVLKDSGKHAIASLLHAATWLVNDLQDMPKKERDFNARSPGSEIGTIVGWL